MAPQESRETERYESDKASDIIDMLRKNILKENLIKIFQTNISEENVSGGC